MMTIAYFTGPEGRRLAYWQTRRRTAEHPTFIWLAGFKSDMTGTKAQSLRSWCEAEGHGCLLFDYSGHGQSAGRFVDGTISIWREDTLSVIDALTSGPLILVGSSMGGWLALLTALARPDRVDALVLIAPAPDFTDKLMWPNLSPWQQAEIIETGQTLQPSDYGGAYPITRALIEDGRTWNLLDAPIAFKGPVRILQGMADPDVPWGHALTLAQSLKTENLILTLIKDGDHRLSRETDIARLLAVCAEVAAS